MDINSQVVYLVQVTCIHICIKFYQCVCSYRCYVYTFNQHFLALIFRALSYAVSWVSIIADIHVSRWPHACASVTTLLFEFVRRHPAAAAATTVTPSYSFFAECSYGQQHIISTRCTGDTGEPSSRTAH